jgi:hypothetical protein
MAPRQSATELTRKRKGRQTNTQELEYHEQLIECAPCAHQNTHTHKRRLHCRGSRPVGNVVKDRQTGDTYSIRATVPWLSVPTEVCTAKLGTARN